MCDQFISTNMFHLFFCLSLFLPGSEGTEYCAGDRFTASCGDNSMVLMTSALYGRMEIGKCVKKNIGFLGCQKDVIQLIDSRCSGRESCEFLVGLNDDLSQLNPCSELLAYLDASFICVSVPSTINLDCRSPITLKQPTMYLSSYTTDTSDCGSTQSHWKIKANPGQKVQVSLYDFTIQQSSGSSNCSPLGFVVEPGVSTNKTICSSHEERQAIVYTSVSHILDISLIPEKDRRRKGAFLLHYEVIGCPDPQLHDTAYYLRDGDNVEIGCKAQEKKWYLECNNNHWEGVVGNCSTAQVDDTTSDVDSGVSALPQSLIIALIIGAAILFSSIVLVCGIVCIYKNGNLQNCCEPKSKAPTLDYESMRYSNHARKIPINSSDQTQHMETCPRQNTFYRDSLQKGYMRPAYQDEQFSGHGSLTPQNYATRQHIIDDNTMPLRSNSQY